MIWLILSYIAVFALGWWLSGKAMVAYLKHELNAGQIPLDEKDIEVIRKFVERKKQWMSEGENE